MEFYFFTTPNFFDLVQKINKPVFRIPTNG